MLKTIELKNFQKHEELFFSFSSGLNLCFGSNWVGKTSFLRAILYALFGSRAVSIKKANLVTFGQRTMSVTLTFEVDGQTYRVVRGTSGARLYRTGSEPIAAGDGPVTDEIEALIGPAKQFLNYQVAKQSETDALLLLGPAKLAQHIEALLGVDLIDKILERIKIERDGAKYVEDLVERLNAEVKLMTEERDRVSYEEKLLRDSVASRERYIAPFKQQAASLRHSLMEAERIQTARDQLSWQISQLTGAVLSASTELAEEEQSSCEAPTEDLTQLRAWLTEQERKSKEYDRLVAALAAARTAEADAAGKLSKMFHVEPANLERLQEVEALCHVLQEKSIQYLQERNALTQAIETGVCQACRRPFSEDFNHAELQQKLEQLIAECEQLSIEHSQLTVERSSLVQQRSLHERYVAEKNRLEVSLAEATNAAVEAEARVREAPFVDKEKLEAGYRRLFTVEAMTKAYAAHKSRLEQLTLKLREVQGKLTEAESKLAELREAPLDLPQTLSAEIATVEAVIAEQVQYASIEATQAAALTYHLSRLSAQIEKASAELQQATFTQARHQRLARLAKYLRENRDSFSAQAWDQILSLAGAFSEAASGGAVTALKRDAGGDFIFIEGGEEMPLEVASGMQKAIFGVAFKIALARTLGSPFAVLLLDEISAAGEDTNALRLTEQLASFGSQVVLISHREADAALADSVLQF